MRSTRSETAASCSYGSYVRVCESLPPLLPSLPPLPSLIGSIPTSAPSIIPNRPMFDCLTTQTNRLLPTFSVLGPLMIWDDLTQTSAPPWSGVINPQPRASPVSSHLGLGHHLETTPVSNAENMMVMPVVGQTGHGGQWADMVEDSSNGSSSDFLSV